MVDVSLTVPFVQARNYTPTSGRQIDLIVVHDMEAPERLNTAENVAAWFAGPSAPRASAHYNIDADSIVGSVRDQDVAWHAPGANRNGLGFEHAGYAGQTRAEWLDDYGVAMLELSAELAAEKVREYDIPVKWLSVEELQAGERGFTSHNNASLAFGRSTHTDPGMFFPVAYYLNRVDHHLGNVSEEDLSVAEADRIIQHLETSFTQKIDYHNQAMHDKKDAMIAQLDRIEGAVKKEGAKDDPGVHTTINQLRAIINGEVPVTCKTD